MREHTIPICRSTLCIRRFEEGTSSFEWISFSTASTTPSLHLIPIAVLFVVVSSVLLWRPLWSIPWVLYCFVCIFHLWSNQSLWNILHTKCYIPGKSAHLVNMLMQTGHILFRLRSWLSSSSLCYELPRRASQRRVSLRLYNHSFWEVKWTAHRTIYAFQRPTFTSNLGHSVCEIAK